jgi:hypothetical protein
MLTAPAICLSLLAILLQNQSQKELASVKRLLGAGDSYAAVEYIQSQETPERVVALYSAATIHFLHKQKDVAAFVRLSQAGIHYELTMAQLAKEPKRVAAFRSQAKTLAYNLAANVWQGWGPETYPATRRQQEIGLDAAKLDLRLAIELDKPAIKLAYAWWMLAATQLGLGDYKAAKKGFLAAAAAASAAKKPVFEYSAQGFLGVTAMLSGKVKAGNEAVKKAKANLAGFAAKGNEEAAFLATQFDHALAAFRPKIK